MQRKVYNINIKINKKIGGMKMINIMKEAHNLTKKIIRKGDSYRETFRLALIFVYSELKKGVNKMVELKGTEKQVKYANDIKLKLVKTINNAMQELEKFQITLV